MKETPILFSTPMVQAILNGTKTQTRRVIKDKYLRGGEPLFSVRYADKTGNTPYQVGNLLWVRERFCKDFYGRYFYYADFDFTNKYHYVHDNERDEEIQFQSNDFKPSIHIPKAAARLWLQITGIRVERLQTIIEADAKAEGVKLLGIDQNEMEVYQNYEDLKHGALFGARNSFASLWCSINGPESWEANPYVWVIEFKVISKTGKP